MGENLNSGSILLLQLVKVFVSFLDLLVQGLVLDLQLFEIDEMQPLGQFFFFLHFPLVL